MLADLFAGIRGGWGRVVSYVHLRLPHGTHCYHTADVSELPEELSDRTVYLVGENGHLWYAAMVCPCGCREVCHMSLMLDGRPRWKLARHARGRISLTPSIWRKTGCHSHFFLQDGRVLWCDDFARGLVGDQSLSGC